MREMGKAYMDWQTRPNVEDGLQLGGGVTYHYKGAGSDIDSCLEGLKTFRGLCHHGEHPRDSDNPEARKTFWSMVDGAHADQIYVHVGTSRQREF